MTPPPPPSNNPAGHHFAPIGEHMGIKISVAGRGTELERSVHRFRYAIYVEEMGRAQKYACHVEKIIREPLDDCSTVFAAVDDRGEVVGTIRYTGTHECPDSEYTPMYRMDHFKSFFPARCSFTTKLMVAEPLRRSTLGARLSMAAWDLGATRADAVNFIDCNEHLIPYFAGLGYVSFPDRLDHVEYGCVQVMALPIRDLIHFRTLRSPFVRRAEALGIEHEELLPAVNDYISLLTKGHSYVS